MAEEDAELIALLLAGDAAVIARVRGWVTAAVGRHRGRLGVESEDLEQEVLLDLIEALEAGRFRQQSRLETYVYSYARFKCIDRLRALGRRDFVELPADALVHDAPSALDELTSQEGVELAQRLFAALPEACRQLWSMIAEGLSYQEMSAKLGIREGALRVRVHRCRVAATELRQRLLHGRM